MAYLLPHLTSGWAVDQAILTEEERVVVIRFGSDVDRSCMTMDEVLSGIAERVKNFAVIYVVDIQQVPDFTAMYELYDACTVMFFFRNKGSSYPSTTFSACVRPRSLSAEGTGRVALPALGVRTPQSLHFAAISLPSSSAPLPSPSTEPP